MGNLSTSFVEQIEKSWVNKRVMVVGDLMLDKYIWGDVDRISPEAPVPVVRAMRNSQQPGGAANVAMNLAGLGARVTVVGFAGDDDDQHRLTALLEDAGIEPIIIVAREFRTISKLRILGRNQQIMRLDVEDTTPPAPQLYDALLAAALSRVSGMDAIILSDYAKGVLSSTVCQSLISAARKLNIPVVVDPKTADFGRYRGATTLCPNLQELSAATRMPASEMDNLFLAAQAMIARLELEYLTVTMSEKGIAVLRENTRFVAPAEARLVFDVSGAGDTVTAVITLALCSGIPIESAIPLANIAAGIVIGKVGTVPIQSFELMAALADRTGAAGTDKVVSLDCLMARTAAWRSEGERVVFTNGCFDLLHVGHITLLERARREGDRLIVAINSDTSIRQLKGPTRPIVGERDRALVLSALAAVDAVIIFMEETPLRLIKAVRPDVLVKGGDYTEATVVGSAEMHSWGGRVALVDTVGGFSTTRLIEQAVAQA